MNGQTGTTNIYVSRECKLTHIDDSTPCLHGLGIPPEQWVEVPLPLLCTDSREVQPKTYPMWVDNILWEKDTINVNINCPCGTTATWVLIYGCQENQHLWEDHLCRDCLTLKTGWSRTAKIRDRIYTATTIWTCMNAVIKDPYGNPVKEVHCDVTRWYAQELTPAMIKNIKQAFLDNLRAQKEGPGIHH